MTSLDRKTRAVNAQDIASQFKLKDKKSLKSLKSKNSELLAKYREKLKESHKSEKYQDSDIESSQDLEEISDKKLIPKVTDSFQGVVFDSKENFDEKKTWKRSKKRDTKGNKSNQQKRSRFKKFKPFNRSSTSKGNNKRQTTND